MKYEEFDEDRYCLEKWEDESDELLCESCEEQTRYCKCYEEREDEE